MRRQSQLMNNSRKLLKSDKAKRLIRDMFKGGWTVKRLANYWKTTVDVVNQILKVKEDGTETK